MTSCGVRNQITAATRRERFENFRQVGGLYLHPNVGIYSLMSATKPELPAAKLDRIRAALMTIEADLTLPLLLTLVVVARHSGLSVNELADQMDVPQQTASRYVGVLQGRYQLPGNENSFARGPLLALEVSTQDPRRRALFLTSRGKSKLTRIAQELYEGTP